MKNTGMTRKLDELGRIVLPKELRTNLGLAEADPLEIRVDGDTILLRKFRWGLVPEEEGQGTRFAAGAPRLWGPGSAICPRNLKRRRTAMATDRDERLRKIPPKGEA